ncbi:MAG: hypothetical protein ACLRMJ_05945 [Alistipes finegoldii]
MQAQNTGLEFGGSVLNHDMLWATDLAQLSQTHVFGTARVMGMGGAFTSLGADLSSMSPNPAGLGMYRRNEISLTPLVPMAKASTAERLVEGNSKSQFAFANVGVALNVFESSRSSPDQPDARYRHEPHRGFQQPLLVFVGIALRSRPA